MQTLTEPLAELVLKSNDDFEEQDIELFNIMFTNRIARKENIFERYSDLSENKRIDFRIIKSCIEDANAYAFF